METMGKKKIEPNVNAVTFDELEKTNLSYEEAANRLEETLQSLESGERSLEESLVLYEEGSILATYCAKKLDEAELRVRKWQPDDEPTEFDDWADIAN